MATYTVPSTFNALDEDLYNAYAFRYQLTFREINKNNRYLSNYKGKIIATKNYITNVGGNTEETATIQEYLTLKNIGAGWQFIDYFYAPVSHFTTSVTSQVYGRYTNAAGALTGQDNICVASISLITSENKLTNEPLPVLYGTNSALTPRTTFGFTEISNVTVNQPDDVLLFFAKNLQGSSDFTGTFTTLHLLEERTFTGTQLTPTRRNVLLFEAWFNNSATRTSFLTIGDGLGSITNGIAYISIDLTSLASGAQQALYTGAFSTATSGVITHFEDLQHIDGTTPRGFVKGIIMGDINNIDFTKTSNDNRRIFATTVPFTCYLTAITDIKSISIYENDPR